MRWVRDTHGKEMHTELWGGKVKLEDLGLDKRIKGCS